MSLPLSTSILPFPTKSTHFPEEPRFLLNLGTYVGAGASCLTDTDYGKQVYCSGSRRGPGRRLFGGPRNARTCAGGVVCGGCDTDGVNRNKRLIAGLIVAQRNPRPVCARQRGCVREDRSGKALTPTPPA